MMTLTYLTSGIPHWKASVNTEYDTFESEQDTPLDALAEVVDQMENKIRALESELSGH